MILLTFENLYEIHKEIKKVDDFRIVISKGTRIVGVKEVSTTTILTVSHAVSLRDALETVWSEIFGRDYSEWMYINGYVPYECEDQEDFERVLEEEPETFLDMLYPYPGEYYVDKVYQNEQLIYSYDA